MEVRGGGVEAGPEDGDEDKEEPEEGDAALGGGVRGLGGGGGPRRGEEGDGRDEEGAAGHFLLRKLLWTCDKGCLKPCRGVHGCGERLDLAHFCFGEVEAFAFVSLRRSPLSRNDAARDHARARPRRAKDGI